MERALTLVVTGTLTTVMAHAAKGKMVTLPRTKNLSTGKESMHQTGFSDASWGFASHAFAKSACRLNDDKFGCLMNDTQAFVKCTEQVC